MAPEWMSGSGEFADGGAILWQGLNFFEKEKKNKERHFRYCVTVNADQLAINSVDLVGENLNPSRITLGLMRVASRLMSSNLFELGSNAKVRGS
jgi:hypothetical protein